MDLAGDKAPLWRRVHPGVYELVGTDWAVVKHLVRLILPYPEDQAPWRTRWKVHYGQIEGMPVGSTWAFMGYETLTLAKREAEAMAVQVQAA